MKDIERMRRNKVVDTIIYNIDKTNILKWKYIKIEKLQKQVKSARI
jgi:hypothetical protein